MKGKEEKQPCVFRAPEAFCLHKCTMLFSCAYQLSRPSIQPETFFERNSVIGSIIILTYRSISNVIWKERGVAGCPMEKKHGLSIPIYSIEVAKKKINGNVRYEGNVMACIQANAKEKAVQIKSKYAKRRWIHHCSAYGKRTQPLNLDEIDKVCVTFCCHI